MSTSGSDEDWSDDEWEEGEEDDDSCLSCNRIVSCARTVAILFLMVICGLFAFMIAGGVYYLFLSSYRTAQMVHNDAGQFLVDASGLCDKEGNEARYGNRGYLACSIARSDVDKSIFWIALEMTFVDIRDAILPKANVWNMALFVVSIFCLLSMAALGILLWMLCGRGGGGRGSTSSSTYYVQNTLPKNVFSSVRRHFRSEVHHRTPPKPHPYTEDDDVD